MSGDMKQYSTELVAYALMDAHNNGTLGEFVANLIAKDICDYDIESVIKLAAAQRLVHRPSSIMLVNVNGTRDGEALGALAFLQVTDLFIDRLEPTEQTVFMECTGEFDTWNAKQHEWLSLGSLVISRGEYIDVNESFLNKCGLENAEHIITQTALFIERYIRGKGQEGAEA